MKYFSVFAAVLLVVNVALAPNLLAQQRAEHVDTQEVGYLLGASGQGPDRDLRLTTGIVYKFSDRPLAIVPTPADPLPNSPQRERPTQVQTGAHGHVVGGMMMQESGLGTYRKHPVIGGGWVYPVRRDRIWVGADVNTITSGFVYWTGSGGPMAVISLGSFKQGLFEPFVHGGPRWGEGGYTRWNLGAGTNVWTGAGMGLRLEYQSEWASATFPGTSRTGVSHFVRFGIVIR